MTGTAWFLTPDSPVPTGGIRTIYRFVDHLVAAGIPAWVVHETRGFRCRWFESDTPVTWLEDVRLGTGDLIVVPEISVTMAAERWPGVPKLVLNQNPYLTFLGAGLPPQPPPDVLPDDVVSIATVSDDAVDYLTLAFPGTRIDRIHYGIDPRLFHAPEGPKERALAFMPRKRAEDLFQVLRILERRRSLDGWRLYPIGNLPEGETARVLRRTAVFLSFNDREGFGLPPVEAMASRCVVAGFAGQGGEEYLRPDTGFPVREGSITDFVRAVENVTSAWDQGERYDDLTSKAATFVASRYSPEHERDDIVRIFSSALATVAGVVPRTATF